MEKHQDDPGNLSVDGLFSSRDFEARNIALVVWSRKAGWYYSVSENPTSPGNDGWDVVRVEAASGRHDIVISGKQLILPGEDRQRAIDGMQFSADESSILLYTNSKRVWRKKTRGDYLVVDLASKKIQVIGGGAAPATLMFAKFSPAGTHVAYVHEHNLYVQDLRTQHICALTSDGNATIINGTGDWVNEEELEIRDGFRWSPDGQAIAFWQFDTTGVPKFSLIDNTAALYPQVISFPYPKVGQVNSATRIGVANIDGGVGGVSGVSGAVRWLAVPGDPRQHYLPEMAWSPDGQQIMLQQLNRLQNTNVVMLARPGASTTQVILTERDAAWVENENPVRWLQGGRAFLWLSERDGWRHAYVVSSDGASCTLLTVGDFDVIDIEAIDELNGWLYYSASPHEPTQRYLFRVGLSGGTPERMSPSTQPGWHTYDIAPDATWAVHTYSTFTAPPLIDLVHLADHRVAITLEDNAVLRSKLAALRAPPCDFFRIDIGDGIVLDGWRILPPDFRQDRKYPLIFHEYGEPAGQTVRDVWGGPRELWHWMLAQCGCIVVSVDSRGTRCPRGRAWRKSVYRKIGIIAPEELAAAAKSLIKRWDFVDAQRVGVWGWSGGGSNTLHAIFRFPDIFSTAIAVAPNANQLLYDSIYQERYMGLPGDNGEGYRLGSPITYAENLRGNLLLVHGTGDDNGHYQGTELLINELIRHHKSFRVMPYPARSHALTEGDQTSAHLYTLMADFFAEHLLAP